MTMPTPLQEGRRGGGHCLFLSPLEKSRSVVMTKLIPHPERRWARCQDPCPSTPEKEKGVIMALPIPLLEGRREGEHGLCLSPLGGRQGGVEFGHPHPISRRRVGKLPGPLPSYTRQGKECGHGNLHPSSRRNEARHVSIVSASLL